MWLGCRVSGVERMSPRLTESLSSPWKLIAVLVPASTLSTLLPWTWIPRTFEVIFDGNIMMLSPVFTLPDARVPVITVPKPFMEKTLSTGSRNMGEKGRSGIWWQILSRVSTKRSSPSPVVEETAMASSMSSSSTRSILVKAINPYLIPMRVQISMCSLVWGITASSAAMAMETMSMPLAPATMFLINLSWPGTSTIPTTSPPGRVMEANPSSIVIPLCFSSLSLSVSMPVNARIRLVFPWSMWPAVPRIIWFKVWAPGYFLRFLVLNV